MNQRGNYKHQTHSKETHILTDLHAPNSFKDYKHQTDIPTDRRCCYPLELEISAVCTRRGRKNKCLGIGGE